MEGAGDFSHFENVLGGFGDQVVGGVFNRVAGSGLDTLP